MTIEEFKGTKWKAGMFCEYDGEAYSIVAVNFSEQLLQLNCGEIIGDCDLWVRCESVKILDALK